MLSDNGVYTFQIEKQMEDASLFSRDLDCDYFSYSLLASLGLSYRSELSENVNHHNSNCIGTLCLVGNIH